MRLWKEEMSSDYENRCGNCHKYLQPSDRYCRYCGTKRGEGAFAPYMELYECIYGPMPVPRTHHCAKCGHSWTTKMMIDNQKFCPECGGNAPCTEDLSF